MTLDRRPTHGRRDGRRRTASCGARIGRQQCSRARRGSAGGRGVTLVVAGERAPPGHDVLAAADPAAFHRGFRAALVVAGAAALLGGVVVGVWLTPGTARVR